MVTFKTLFNKNNIFAALMLFLMGVLALFLIGYFLSRETNMLVAQKRELAKLENDLALLDKILVDRQVNQERIDAVSESLPQTYEEVAFAISQFEAVALRNQQVLETKIEAASSAEQGDLASVKISLKTEGSYSNFSRMLSDLARLPYHTRVDSLKIEEAQGRILSQANLRLYLGKESAK